jgi:hypothetical protein
MATFVIIPADKDHAPLDKAIAEKFGNKSFCLPQGEWFVSYDGTSTQLSNELGISDGAIGAAVVLNFSGYWGRAGKDIWEWLKENAG